MEQHPKATVGWAVNGLERAIRELAEGPTERRVRGQLHQLILAIERDASTSDIQHGWFSAQWPTPSHHSPTPTASAHPSAQPAQKTMSK